jgi:prepilin-type N-terminal cleavage/methylation domain-containing protein
MSNFRRFEREGGFSFIELLVALSISSIVMAMVIGSVLTLRDTYFADIKRTQVNGNLRSAMDIISMNIRQTGENLVAAFPAIELVDGASGASDSLALRRSAIVETLTLCEDAVGGATQLFVSSASVVNAECIPANAAPLHTIFMTELAAATETPTIYVYDKVARVGEFVRFVSGGIDGSGQYNFTTDATSRAYSKVNTALYIIEEYRFSVDDADDRLELTINDDAETRRPVAFDITNFQVQLDMEDGGSISSFLQTGPQDWKDIRQVNIQLSGEESYKGRPMRSTIEAKFFPRNVLSYEGS